MTPNEQKTHVTRRQLAKALHATDPEGAEFVIAPACHQGAAVVAVFALGTGALRLQCSTCGRHVLEVRVAAR